MSIPSARRVSLFSFLFFGARIRGQEFNKCGVMCRYISMKALNANKAPLRLPWRPGLISLLVAILFCQHASAQDYRNMVFAIDLKIPKGTHLCVPVQEGQDHGPHVLLGTNDCEEFTHTRYIGVFASYNVLDES